MAEALLQDKALRESLKVAIPKRAPAWLRAWSRMKAVAMIWLLYAIALPISLAGVVAGAAQHLFRQEQQEKRKIPAGARGTALVSGESSHSHGFIARGLIHVNTKTALHLQRATELPCTA